MPLSVQFQKEDPSTNTQAVACNTQPMKRLLCLSLS